MKLRLPEKYYNKAISDSLDYHLKYEGNAGYWITAEIYPWDKDAESVARGDLGGTPEAQVWMLVPVDPQGDQIFQIDYFETTNDEMTNPEQPFSPFNDLVERKLVKNKGWDGDLDTVASAPQEPINDIAAIFIRPAYVSSIVHYGIPHSLNNTTSENDMKNRTRGTPLWLPIMTTLAIAERRTYDEEKDPDGTAQWVMVSIDPTQWKVGGAWEVGLPNFASQDLKKLLSNYEITGPIPNGSGNAWLWNTNPLNPNRWPKINIEGVDHAIMLDQRAADIMKRNLNPIYHDSINREDII